MGKWITSGQGGAKQWVPTNPYCTAEEVFIELRDVVPSQGANKWNEVQIAIENASRYIDRWKGRDYFQHDLTTTPVEIDQFYPGYHKKEIHLVGLSPIIDESTLIVKVNGTTLTSNSDFSAENKEWPDGGASVILRPLNWVSWAYYGSYAADPWGLDRSASRVMQVYGLFGYDQRAIKDGAGNVTGYGASGTYADTEVPDCPTVLRMACRSIAAAMSGHLKKEFVDLDGQRQTVITKNIDDIAKEILGTKYGTVLA